MADRRGSVVRRTVLAAACLGGLVLCATHSHSQASLTAEQSAARDEFDKTLRASLARTKEKCGDDFKLVTDFEHYDDAAWKAANGRWNFTTTACGEALAAAATACAGPEVRTEKGSAPTKPASRTNAPQPAAVSVKRLTCLFTGADAKRPGEEHEDHMRRNAKVEAGALTLPLSPQLGYSVPGCYEGVLRGTATYHSLAAGASCKEPWECGSGLCSGGVCRTCSAKRKCPGKFDVCLEGGVCRMATPPNHSSSSSSSDASSSPTSGGSKPKGLERGRMCSKGSECQSGSC